MSSALARLTPAELVYLATLAIIVTGWTIAAAARYLGRRR